MARLAKPGDFCPNQECPDYEKLQSASQHNIIKTGKTKAGVQRHECTTCHRTCTATKGTIFYGKRTSAATILETLAFLAAGAFFSILQRRGHPDAPPPTISDGWGGMDDAILAVYGLTPEYGGRGRPPTRKKPGKAWLYLQMVKQHDEHGHFTGTKLKAIFANQQELLQLLGGSTAYIERSNLTSRMFNGRQTRKTLAFSKELGNHRAAALWEDAYYNLLKHHKSLRLPAGDIPGRKWIQRTPMMVAGLADHAWTVNELLTTIPLKR